MTRDPKLVEALARFVYGYDPMDKDDDREWQRQLRDCERFIARHRIVQLPEEPSGWVPVTEEGVPVLGGVRKRKQDAEDYGLPVRPLYTGDPQEVEP